MTLTQTDIILLVDCLEVKMSLIREYSKKWKVDKTDTLQRLEFMIKRLNDADYEVSK